MNQKDPYRNLTSTEGRVKAVEWIDNCYRKNKNKVKNAIAFEKGVIKRVPSQFMNRDEKPYAFFLNALKGFCDDLRKIEQYSKK